MAVIPVYNVLVVPHANIYLKTDFYTQMSGRAPVTDERVYIIVAKEQQTRDEMTDKSFYPIGLSGTISEINNNGYLVIRTHDRVNINEVTVYHDHSIDLDITRRADINDLDPEEADRRLKAVKKAMIKFAEGFQWGQMSRAWIAQWTSMSEVAAAMSPWITNSVKEKYAVLAEDSLAKREDLMESMIYENLEMTKINNEAKEAQEEDYQKIYRESAIRKQIEYLQKELDEMHPESVSDIRRYELKIEESGMNETARKEAEKVLNRLKKEGQNSAESGMLYDYLDYVTSLSWKKEPAQPIDLGKAAQILDNDHFGLKKVKERIIQQIAVMNLKHQQSGSILLFVGAPGTGKTSIGQSIARALNREYVRVSLGGVRDEADIRGHRRTYIGAMPGRIMDGIQKSGVSNPVMVLDEVDKLSASYNGDPASALLEVLDPEQNSTFTDHYMNVPYDLSDVMFICTANTLETIPAPLLNRMEVIQFQGYTPIEKFQIARRHLLPKAMRSVGIKENDLEVTDEALREIISDYTREAGVRGLKKRMDTLCRRAAVDIVENKERQEHETASAEGTASAEDSVSAEETDSAEKNVPVDHAEAAENAQASENRAAAEKDTGTGEPVLRVTPDKLRDYLDMHPIHHRRVPEKTNPGIVTGLAWTSVGGEILYIETMFTKGSGKIIVTGQLGDVMKESAQIAVSLVKSMFPDKADMFEENDLHIHVPDGATPKDGPSAGITLTTAISSLVNGKAVSPHIAMTGEVSLRGGVNPIGGLPEKLMAAQRAGVTKVFIPEENVEDLDEVADEVKSQLEILPVSEVSDVLVQTGICDASDIGQRSKVPDLKAV